MQPFRYARVGSAAEAARLLEDEPEAVVLAGGTNLVDLLKLRVVRPSLVVDVTRAGFDEIEEVDGGLRIGAGVRNSDLADDARVRADYPVLADAIHAGASPQLRHMATVGGNLLQRTRCWYFMDAAAACNRREPGSGCDALSGPHRQHAILGVSEHCIAAHPSDMCVALAALDADIATDRRTLPFHEFHLQPGATPERQFALERSEIVVAVHLGAAPRLRWTYLKVRDRASFAFALVSVATGLRVEENRIADARLALGGVGTVPWRAREAERELVGKEAGAEAFRAAAERALETAQPHAGNAFKVELAQRAIVRALEEAAA